MGADSQHEDVSEQNNGSDKTLDGRRNGGNTIKLEKFYLFMCPKICRVVMGVSEKENLDFCFNLFEEVW